MTTTTLPQKDLRAKDLDKDLFPPREILKAYEKVGKLQDYDRSGHDRCWEIFYDLVNGNEKTKNQLIEQKVSGLQRIKDKNGEWLVYFVNLFGKNWKGNRVDFSHLEGKVSNGIVDGVPEFTKEINPQTDEIVPGTTQIHGMKQVYTIPFSKQKVNELIPYFDERVGFSVEIRGAGSRPESCSLEEFRDMEYDELVNLKTGFTDYLRTKRQDQLKVGGVR